MEINEIAFAAVYLYFGFIFFREFRPGPDDDLWQRLSCYAGGGLLFIMALSPIWSTCFRAGSALFLVLLTLSGFFAANRMRFVFKRRYFKAKESGVCSRVLKKMKYAWKLTSVITIGSFLGVVVLLLLILQNLSRLTSNLRI